MSVDTDTVQAGTVPDTAVPDEPGVPGTDPDTGIVSGALRGPFQGLHWAAPFTGSVVLARILRRHAVAAVAAVRRARANAATQKGKGAPKKDAAPAGESDQDGEDAAPKRGKTAAGGDLLEKVVIAAVAAFVGFSALAAAAAVVAPYVRPAFALGAVVWFVTALAVAPPRGHTTPENDHEKLAGESATDLEAAALWLRHRTYTAVQEAVADGRRGIHLATIVETCLPDWDVTALRTRLELLEIPVRRTLNIRGVGNTSGIHVGDLENALGRPLPDALADLPPLPPRWAGQSTPGDPPGGHSKGARRGPLARLRSRRPAPSAATSPRPSTLPPGRSPSTSP